ncbi:MAG: alpha/beta hydrolase [Pseudomonadota bacterium]
MMVLANGIAQSVVLGGRPHGLPVLLIHGLGWDAERLWTGLMQDPAIRSWRLLAPDLRGVGQSAPLDRPYSISAYADDIAALLDALHIEACALVGFSMGGMVATELAARLGERALGLALCCAGLKSTPASEQGVEAMLARAAELGPSAFAAEQADAIWHPEWAAAHPDAVADFKKWRAAMDQDALFHAFRAPAGCDLTEEFAKLTCPVATLFAADDAFIPLEDARATAALNKGASFTSIDPSGHMAPIEQPEQFNQAIAAFLSRCQTAKRAA